MHEGVLNDCYAPAARASPFSPSEQHGSLPWCSAATWRACACRQ